jgi:predicted secreted Zn-dependent protease
MFKEIKQIQYKQKYQMNMKKLFLALIGFAFFTSCEQAQGRLTDVAKEIAKDEFKNQTGIDFDSTKSRIDTLNVENELKREAQKRLNEEINSL